MVERPKFQQVQYALAAHIRDPERNAAPEGIEDRRLGIYRDLFFNNVSKMLAGTFPVLRKILGDEAWQTLMRDYFSKHQAHTPYFLEMPQEFLSYLGEERGARPGDPPFLEELAHYEWVELALSVADVEPDWSCIDREGDLMAGTPVLSPLAWPLAYDFPVHRISPDWQPGEPGDQPTYLVVSRDSDDKVSFIEINIVTARLLELLQQETALTGESLLEQIAVELAHPEPRVVVDGGREILADLHRREVLLGTRRRAADTSADFNEPGKQA